MEDSSKHKISDSSKASKIHLPIIKSKDQLILEQQEMQTKEDRCTGQCCEAFITTGPDKLKFMLHGEMDETMRKELIVVSEMLVHIESAWYTCKYFNDKTRNCDNYENRPKMCRDYPYGKSCKIFDCSWSHVRDKDGLSEDEKELIRIRNLSKHSRAAVRKYENME